LSPRHYFFKDDAETRGTTLQDCQADNFESLTYTFSQINRFLKYKFVEDIENDEYYTFDGALNACIDLDATLWGLVDGKSGIR